MESLAIVVSLFGEGSLPIDYAKSHHQVWYKKLTGKKA
jgi:hypothetical protein